MPFFHVIVEQIVHRWVTVEADTPEDAEECAISEAASMEGGEVVQSDIFSMVRCLW